MTIVRHFLLLSVLSLSAVLIGCKDKTVDKDASFFDRFGGEEPKADPNAPSLPKVNLNPGGNDQLGAVERVRLAAARSQSQNNLKQIILAFHNHEAAFNSIPAAAITDAKGNALLSWRVAILPFIEQDALYKQFKLNEPWDSPNNKALLKQMPKIYGLPTTYKPGDIETNYRVFISPAKPSSKFRAPFTLGGPPLQFRIATIADGSSNTIAVVEAAESVPWTKPEGLEFDDSKPLPKMGNFWGGKFNAAMFDGSVLALPTNWNEKDFRRAISHSDGEPYAMP